MEQMLFGEILLNFHLISRPDLDRCLELQQRLDPQPPLGQILIQQGLIDEKVLATVLSVQNDELGTSLFEGGKSKHEVARTLERATIDDFLNTARRLGASDLFLSSGRRPARRSVTTSPAISFFSAWGVPSATTRPWSMMASRSHRASASSR